MARCQDSRVVPLFLFATLLALTVVMACRSPSVPGSPSAVPSGDSQSLAAQGPISGVPAPLRIVQVAQSYVGRYDLEPCNCKLFVRAVTSEATGGKVSIPATILPSAYKWNAAPYIQKVLSSDDGGIALMVSALRVNTRQGDMFQLKPISGAVEHTLIVAAADTNGLRAVEANYPTCGVRNTRYVTFLSLATTYRWTMYRVTL